MLLKQTQFILVACCILMTNCAQLPQRVENNQNGAFGITVGMMIHHDLLEWRQFLPRKVFFIKLEDKNDNIKKVELLTSNYSYESWWGNLKIDSIDSYLLNVEPGFYAAIGALGETGKRDGHIFVYFPEAMVNASVIKVQPDEMTYMGRYILNTGPLLGGMKNADQIQIYYYNELSSDYSKMYSGQTITNAPTPLFQAPQVKEIQNDKELELRFLKKSLSVFKKTAWVKKIQNRLNTLASE